jgi:ATP-dependent RNA helicase DDX5/DBP2
MAQSSTAPFEKKFYHEHPDVTARSEVDIKTYREEKKIHVEGKGTPRPVTSFEEASFPGQEEAPPKSQYDLTII